MEDKTDDVRPESISSFFSYVSDDEHSDDEDFHDGNVERTSLRKSSEDRPKAKLKTTVKEGYLVKMCRPKDKGAKRKWLRYHVRADLKYFKYRPDEKKHKFSRIIPVSTMINIENDIQEDKEPHRFRMRLTTIDRVYTFALETDNNGSDLLFWTQIIKYAILESREELRVAGDMENPDKKGEVSVIFPKHRRGINVVVAVKADVMCLYRNNIDYNAWTPIEQIDLKLVSIRPLMDSKLQINAINATYTFIFESVVTCHAWLEAMQESKIKGLSDDKVLKEIYENDSNRACADCGAKNPTWAAINLGITLCQHCAGIHRDDVSTVRSLCLDVTVWTESLKKVMLQVGNENSNALWEDSITPAAKLEEGCSMEARRDFILAKYEDKKYFKYHESHTDQAALDEALCQNVRTSQILETVKILFSGANIHHESSENNQTALHLAREAEQSLQAELLIRNGAEAEKKIQPVSPSRRDVHIKLCGYLHKTGSNFSSDFLKRWAILDKDDFKYYENETSKVTKGTVEIGEMLSVAHFKDERRDFAFVVGTSKGHGGAFLFAAESERERLKWVTGFCKAIGKSISLKWDSRIVDQDFRGGLVQLRLSQENPWVNHWLHVDGKTLFIYQKEEELFRELDLRKVNNLVYTEDKKSFVVSFPDCFLYLKSATTKETNAWFGHLDAARKASNGFLVDQTLTSKDIPVIVNKCIDFITLHGMKTIWVYRERGYKYPLLDQFKTDAKSVYLLPDTHDVYDVATVLKEFFVGLKDSVLTRELYQKWIDASASKELSTRIDWYKSYLSELHPVHVNTLREVIIHLAMISDFAETNLMSSRALAEVFGPILMSGSERADGVHKREPVVRIAQDMIDNYPEIFEISRRRNIELPAAPSIVTALKIEIVIQRQTDSEDIIEQPVSNVTTALELRKALTEVTSIGNGGLWDVYDIISNGELTRPLHYTESVVDVIARRADWPAEIRGQNRLVFRRNTLYELMSQMSEKDLTPLEIQFGKDQSKNYKKRLIEICYSVVRIWKDTKKVVAEMEWSVSETIAYVGTQKQRLSAIRGAQYGLTFITKDCKMKKNLYGYSVVFSSASDLHKCLAAFWAQKHPDGISPKEETT